MPEGSTLLLFTDGLFERRGVPLDEGRAQVRELLAAARPACRWTSSATGCSPSCSGRGWRTTSPSSPSGRTRVDAAAPGRGRARAAAAAPSRSRADVLRTQSPSTLDREGQQEADAW